MSEREYRIKKNSGEEIGPMSEPEFKKQTIDFGDEVYRKVAGEWVREDQKEETFLMNLKNISLEEANLEENLVEENNEAIKEFKFDHVDPFEEGSEPPTKEDLNVNPIKGSNDIVDEDKTIVTPSTENYLKRLQEEQKIKKEKEEEEKKSEIENTPIDYEAESTRVIDLAELNVEIKEAKKSEKKLEKEAKLENSKRLKEELDNYTNEDEIDEVREVENNEKVTVKKKKILYAVVALALGYFLFGEDDKTEKKINLVTKTPEISFPQQFDSINLKLAKENYDSARIILANQTYISKLKAIAPLLLSVENKFEDNPAMAKLIFTYAVLLKNSKEYNDDAHAVFKLVQIFKRKSTKDPAFASAIAKFYIETKKYNAALKTIDKYITLNPKKASVELYSVYLESLTKVGNLSVAKKIVERLVKTKRKNIYTVSCIVEYYKLIGEEKSSRKLIEEALKIYPKSAYLNLELAEIYKDNKNLTGLKQSLERAKIQRVEYSKILKAKYLKLLGMYFVLIKKYKLANKAFNESLELFDSEDLINQLALLSESDDEKSNILIRQSKAKKLIRNSKKAVQEQNIRRAFSLAIEASEIAPKYLPVQLWLAKLQMERGYLNDAIDQLSELFKENRSSRDVIYSLIEAYIRAFKFKDATALLNSVRNIDEGKDDRYFTASSMFYLYKKEYLKSSGWLQRAINANPLNDKNIYIMAKLYIDYKKFGKGKYFLNKAMELDPANVDYRLSFAEILYEMESSTSAIGYLYNVLKDFPDNPKILSAIGIYFYRSGQIKNYEEIKEKLTNIPKKDISLYRFMIESGKLDENYKSVISNSLKLLELAPGDLEGRLYLARVYLEQADYSGSLGQLKKIKERIDTYPRLHYYFAKIYLLLDDLDLALPQAQKEVKENPSVVDGHILLADIYKKMKDIPSAQKGYFKANQLEPQNVDAIMGLAYVSFINNRYDMALDQYQKAKELDPNRSDVYKLLGDAFRKIGQSQMAIKNYKYFLELSPNTSYKNKIETYINTMQ